MLEGHFLVLPRLREAISAGAGRKSVSANNLIIFLLAVTKEHVDPIILLQRYRGVIRRRQSKTLSKLRVRCQRKLQMLDDAMDLRDLSSSPGNRLEKLVGARSGQHSIRINRQWRVCFVWTELGPDNVEIVDYH